MSDFWVERTNGGLSPRTAEDAAVMSQLPFGKPIQITAKTPRNSRFNALYWILCTRIGNAIGQDKETISDMLKIGTGHATIVKSKTYGVLRLPKSIAFAKMSEEDFRQFFERCAFVISAEWAIEKPEVYAAVSDLLLPEEAQAR